MEVNKNDFGFNTVFVPMQLFSTFFQNIKYKNRLVKINLFKKNILFYRT